MSLSQSLRLRNNSGVRLPGLIVGESRPPPSSPPRSSRSRGPFSPGRNDGMSKSDTKSPSSVRVIGSALIAAFCVALVPVLLLSLAYLEHVLIGTHRLKESLHVDQLLHDLEAVLLPH